MHVSNQVKHDAARGNFVGRICRCFMIIIVIEDWLVEDNECEISVWH